MWGGEQVNVYSYDGTPKEEVKGRWIEYTCRIGGHEGK